MLTQEQLFSLAEECLTPGAEAVLLLGSYARGDAGPYSDVDLLRLTGASIAGQRSVIWQKKLVNVTDADPATIDAWFSEPEQAVEVVAGLREARVLRDREGTAARLVARAEAFVWTPELQEKANRWASTQLAGWAEEAHKGLAGLRTSDTGRLLNAQFGLSWGLAKTVRVQRGLLSNSDNAFFADLQIAFAGTRLLRSLHAVYGLTGLALPEQVRAGLELYVLTADLLKPALHDSDRPIIEHTVHLLRQAE